MEMTQSQIKTLKAFGETIKKKRKELGFSQESFAYQCKLHRTYMGAIERGERNISMINIMRISKALKIKISDLFILSDL